jgi:putative ABC transport system ATP-binding protein
MSIIKTDNLGHIYRTGKIDLVALSSINLVIDEGEFISVIGPSGSGKTTLLNMIGGLDSPTSGRVFFEDEEITRLSPARLTEIRLNKMGFVFQSYNLIPVLTALENVEYVMLLQGISDRERKKRALEALVEVGLKDCCKRRPLELSGGQQQRVAVARAIVSCPRIVLADEPTANLDSRTGAGLMDLLADINQRKEITFVFFTHDPVVVEHTRRIVKLKDGKIEE